MFSRRILPVLAALAVLAFMAACAPLPAATQAPSTQPATVAPAATVATIATPTSVPSPTAVMPDPKTDPVAALSYAGNSQLFKTAEFTYTMTMNMAPADDASAKALGAQADQLKGYMFQANGSGALEVTDPSSLKSKMRMDMEMQAGGQGMAFEMVLIDQTAWIKMKGDTSWKKLQAEQAKSVMPGMSPEQLLENFKDAAGVKWVEDVTVDGEQLSHLQFTVDPSKLDLGALSSVGAGSNNITPEQLQSMMKDMKPVVDVWLSKPGLQMRGEKMQLEFNVPLPAEANAGDAKIKLSIVMDMKFSKVNEPVTIEAPAE